MPAADPSSTGPATGGPASGGGAAVNAAPAVRTLCWALVRTDRTVRMADVAAVGEALGCTEQQLRHGVRRLRERDGLTREGRGRHGVVRLPPSMDELWDLDHALVGHAYRQDAGLAPWDGRWRLLTSSVPETRRADRDRLRSRLVDLGGAAVSPGTYVSPHDWWEVVLPMVDRLDLVAHVTWGELDRLVVAGTVEPRTIAARLWSTDALATAYATAHDRTEEAVRAWPSLGAPGRLHAWVGATAAIIEPFEIDPLLPPELAEPVGRPARAAYAALTGRFLADVEGADGYAVAVAMADAAGVR